MDTTIKYRKESENYMPHGIHHHKAMKHHPSHVKFVVPWQMVEVNKEKEEAK